MVALLKDDGEFVPTLVVRDPKAFKALAESMDKKKEPSPGLKRMLTENKKRFVVRSK